MSAIAIPSPDAAQVLAKAFLNAGKALGLTQHELASVIGKDRSAIHRSGIDPLSKAGELALLFIRAYRALYALVGGDAVQLRHWMHTYNQHIGAVPARSVHSVQGLAEIVGYLDAIRGKL